MIFESKALTLFDISLVIALSASELIDLMTMMTSSFELTLNLSYHFELRNFMKLSVKIKLMTAFGEDIFAINKICLNCKIFLVRQLNLPL